MTHARGRGRPARWSLRSKLLVLLVTLLALVCVVVGVATALLLRGFLVGRLDSQLVSAGGRSVMAGGGPPGGPDDGGAQDTGAQFLLAPGQAAGTLGARISGGAVTAAGVLGNDGSLKLLPARWPACWRRCRSMAMCTPSTSAVREITGFWPP